MSGVLRTEPGPDRSDLSNRWPAETESPAEITERWVSSPISPRCVVCSDPLHCIYILCVLLLLGLLEIVNSDGMLSGRCRPWLQHPGDAYECMCERVKRIAWRGSAASWPRFLPGFMGMQFWFVQLPLSVSLFPCTVTKGITWTTHRLDVYNREFLQNICHFLSWFE